MMDAQLAAPSTARVFFIAASIYSVYTESHLELYSSPEKDIIRIEKTQLIVLNIKRFNSDIERVQAIADISRSHCVS